MLTVPRCCHAAPCDCGRLVHRRRACSSSACSSPSADTPKAADSTTGRSAGRHQRPRPRPRRRPSRRPGPRQLQSPLALSPPFDLILGRRRRRVRRRSDPTGGTLEVTGAVLHDVHARWSLPVALLETVEITATPVACRSARATSPPTACCSSRPGLHVPRRRDADHDRGRGASRSTGSWSSSSATTVARSSPPSQSSTTQRLVAPRRPLQRLRLRSTSPTPAPRGSGSGGAPTRDRGPAPERAARPAEQGAPSAAPGHGGLLSILELDEKFSQGGHALREGGRAGPRSPTPTPRAKPPSRRRRRRSVTSASMALLGLPSGQPERSPLTVSSVVSVVDLKPCEKEAVARCRAAAGIPASSRTSGPASTSCFPASSSSTDTRPSSICDPQTPTASSAVSRTSRSTRRSATRPAVHAEEPGDRHARRPPAGSRHLHVLAATSSRPTPAPTGSPSPRPSASRERCSKGSGSVAGQAGSGDRDTTRSRRSARPADPAARYLWRCADSTSLSWWPA